MASNMLEEVAFHEMGLDDRILKAIARLGWSSPTLIQEKAIPLALEGKDILARAKTGSGKTGAYAIPLVQKLLERKDSSITKQSRTCVYVRALVLVPSKELSKQASTNIKEISSCSKEVKVMDISNSTNTASQRMVLLEKPDIIVGTPNRVLAHIKDRTLHFKNSLEVLVVDEADLLFSFGYEEDVKNLLNHFPSIYQAFLMSATLSEEVDSLKKILLHSPVILKLEESDLPEERLTQYQIKCSMEDKFLLIYALLKLKLVKGKTLLFVNNIDRCYKLKLFLEQFSVKSCVLNSELPHNSRCHTISEFNRGIYDYIIATDEIQGCVSHYSRDGGVKARTKKRKRDKEYSVARGIDFQGVENVINFDCPLNVDTYIHRVGRTARGHEHGTALTFVTPEEEGVMSQVEERLVGVESDTPTSSPIKPYRFRMTEVEGFRYRVKDALRAVTKASIRDAWLKEIRIEMLNSKRLQTHFDENPRDLQVLRHDGVLQPTRVQPHLKYIPSYLVPKALKVMEGESAPESKAFSFKKRKMGHKSSRKNYSTQQRRKDPLRTYGQR